MLHSSLVYKRLRIWDIGFAKVGQVGVGSHGECVNWHWSGRMKLLA